MKKTIKQLLEDALLKASQEHKQALRDEQQSGNEVEHGHTDFLDGIACGLHRALDIIAEADEGEWLVEGVSGNRIQFRVRADSKEEAMAKAEAIYDAGGDYERVKEADHYLYGATRQ